jgi:glucose-1-phosphate thymidylyltransferase
MNNVKISSFGFLSRTIIGEGTTIGPGFTAEAGKARVEAEDRMMDANVGAIVGDNTDISGNVLTKPGCVVGIRCKVGSGTVIRNFIPDNTKVV